MIVHSTKAKVVLSSTWREGWNKEDESKNESYFNELRDKLLEYDISLFDKTPELSRSHNRGEVIGMWLDSLDYKIDSFIILDDYNDMGYYESHLLQTAGGRGLTDDDVEIAINYLNEKDWKDLSLKSKFAYWKDTSESVLECAKCRAKFNISKERFSNYRYCPYCGRRNISQYDYVHLDWYE